MAIDVTSVFAEYLSGNRGPIPGDSEQRQPPNYGVEATLSVDGLEVELTFRSGSAYCCPEWGCHLALIDGHRWNGLRRRLAAHAIPAPPRLKLWVVCVIEEGAAFFDFGQPDPGRRSWFAFASATAHSYHATATEAASPAGQVASTGQPGD